MKHYCPLPRRWIVRVAAWIAMAFASLAYAQTVQITSPSTATVANPGQTLAVAVAVSGATLVHAFVAGDTPIGFSQDLISPPYQFIIQVPTSIRPGSYQLTAVGAGSANITVACGSLSSTVPIVVEPLLKVLPAQTSLYTSQTEKFDAYFKPVPDSGSDVTWTLTPALGSIDANGL